MAKARKKTTGRIRIAVPENPKIEIRRIAVVHQAEIYSDVLERIDGYESYVDVITEYNNTIYKIDVFKKILTDPEDDTNATTKYRIEKLMNKIGKNVDYLMIVG